MEKRNTFMFLLASCCKKLIFTTLAISLKNKLKFIQIILHAGNLPVSKIILFSHRMADGISAKCLQSEGTAGGNWQVYDTLRWGTGEREEAGSGAGRSSGRRRLGHGDATRQKQGGATNRNHGEKGYQQKQEETGWKGESTTLHMLMIGPYQKQRETGRESK